MSSPTSSPTPLPSSPPKKFSAPFTAMTSAGCTVSLGQYRRHRGQLLRQTAARNGEWLEKLYEKVVEAVHLLSTPPDKTKVTEPKELQSLLTQRLDAIHAITSKTIETLAIVRGKKAPPLPPEPPAAE